MSSTEKQTRFCRCVICQKEGEVVKRFSQKEILDQQIPYSGAYVFQGICTDCQRTYIHPDVQMNWNVEQDSDKDE